MRHPCNLCSLQFATEAFLEKHLTSFHSKPDASRPQSIFPVVLEKIKIEPELIRLVDEEDDDDQTMSTVQKQPPKDIFEKLRIPQNVKRLQPKDCYQCEVCLETFSLLRYFRKHLTISEKQGFVKCQEHYEANNIFGYLPLCEKSCLEGNATAKDGQTTEKKQIQSRQRKTEIFPTPQDASCKECHLTCASYEQLCIHYSKHHNLPVVVLKHVDKHELYQKYAQNKKGISSNNKFKCDTCTRNFSSHYYLKKHTTSGPCANCHSSEDCLKTLKANISISEINAPKSRVDLCMEEIVKYPEKPYELRKNTSSKLPLLSKHNFATIGQFNLKCNICKRQFSSLTVLRKHKLAVHNVKKVSLYNSQQRQCRLISNPKIRKRVGQGNPTNSHQCSVCHQEFLTQPQFKRHKIIAHQQNPFECDLCRKKYSSKRYLKFHKLTVHEKFRFTCDLCQRYFSKKHDLIQHKRAAHEGFRHKCEICLKEFEILRILNQHKQICHSDIRLKCELCPKEFALLSKLRIHKLIAHDGVRQKCEICLKEYKHMHQLKTHILTAHDGVRHKCASCPETFTQLGHLNQHKRTAHDGFCNTCDICQKNFRGSGYLKQHKTTVHLV